MGNGSLQPWYFFSLLTNFGHFTSSEATALDAARKIEQKYPQMKPIASRSNGIGLTLGGMCTII